MTPLSPLGRLDTRRRHALVMLLVLVVVATPLVLRTLKLKLQLKHSPIHLLMLVLHSGSGSLVLEGYLLLILQTKLSVKKATLLIRKCVRAPLPIASFPLVRVI